MDSIPTNSPPYLLTAPARRYGSRWAAFKRNLPIRAKGNFPEARQAREQCFCGLA